MKQWQCSVCKYVHTGEEPPEKCPVCAVPASKFAPHNDDAAVPDAPDAGPTADKDTTGTPDTPDVSDSSDAPASENENRMAAYMATAADLMVRHHGHPMSVHLPNGVIPVIATLSVIAWFSGSELFARAGFINLVFVLISLPLVGLTGVLEWKKKYCGATTSLFKIKIAAAAVTGICCMTSFIWYLVDPEVLASPRAWGFVMINLMMLGAAGVAGHIGGKLVFRE